MTASISEQRIGELRREIINLRKEVHAGHQRENQLARLIDTCQFALRVVSSGIWRDRRRNACGLSGAAVAVHQVEEAIKLINNYIEGKPERKANHDHRTSRRPVRTTRKAKP